MSNSFSFVGRLGRDAELKTVGQSTVCEFSCAHDIGFGDRKQTLWTKCALWGKQGEALAKFLVKGKQVWVSGELSLREYDAKDGTKKTSAEVRVQSIDLVGGRSDGGESSAPVNSRPTPASPTATQAEAPVDMPF